MSEKVRVSGTWRDANPYIKVGGSWKLTDYVWNKVGGEWYTSFVKGGLVDRSWDNADVQDDFFTGTGGTGTGLSAAVQSDGKILVGGLFTMTSWDGTSIGKFVRLNTNGTLDTAFMSNVGSGSSSNVESIAVQSDGKILVGGLFTSWDGTTAGRLVRLNADGTLDTAFMSNIGTGSSGRIYSILIQSDGKILLGGDSAQWNGTTAGRLVRLNSDGTLDTAFASNVGAGANDWISDMSIQSDGKIVAGGIFTSWQGTSVGRLVRLNTNGTLDTAFMSNVGVGGNERIEAVAVQSDGKIILGGWFTVWSGASVGRIVRLNSNGTRDTVFTTNTGTGANSYVYEITVQSDGKILVGGEFGSWDGIAVDRLIRLNTDGTTDVRLPSQTQNGTIYAVIQRSDGKLVVVGGFSLWSGFAAGTTVILDSSLTLDINYPQFANSSVWPIVVQSDGKIIVAGYFTTWNGVTVNRLARLNIDGTLDTAFAANTGTGANNIISSLAIQPDGKILAVGELSSWNGTAVGRIVRLNADGSLDTGFVSNVGSGSNSFLYSVALQSDGKILVGGQCTSWNGIAVNYLVRLNSDGSHDFGFSTNTGGNNRVRSIAVQPDGKILVGGDFTSWLGTTVGRIARVNPSDGTLDTTFTANNGTGANSIIAALAVQSDGKIVPAGFFTSWNGTTVGRLVRLNANGALDSAFTANNGTGADNGFYGLALQPDGKILAAGTVKSWNGTTSLLLVRINTNGTLDTAFSSNLGSSTDSFLNSVAVQSDGKILVGGGFNKWNGRQRRKFLRLGGEIAA